MWKYTEYLEPYLREVREVKVLGDAIDPDTGAAQRHMTQVYHNQFVTTCNADALQRRERLFEISADPAAETMDFRRKRLQGRYSMKLPLTMNFLLRRLDAIIGKDMYDCWVEYGDWHYRLGSWRLGVQPFRDEEYVLHIDAVTESAAWYHEVHVLVNKVKPANIVFAFSPMATHNVAISESVGTYPMKWNYRLGSWRLGYKPFLSVGDKVASSWNYRLGSWQLGQKPFGEHPNMEVVKLPEHSSIRPDFLNEHAQLSAIKVAAVRLNGSLTIHELQKAADGDTATIRYTVSALMGINEITGIELLREDGSVITASGVYIPVPGEDQVIIKHVIPHKEGVVNG